MPRKPKSEIDTNTGLFMRTSVIVLREHHEAIREHLESNGSDWSEWVRKLERDEAERLKRNTSS